jgi:hypothetical protein
MVFQRLGDKYNIDSQDVQETIKEELNPEKNRRFSWSEKKVNYTNKTLTVGSMKLEKVLTLVKQELLIVSLICFLVV